MKNYFDIYILDDSKWFHTIYESLDEYFIKGHDLDNNGKIDEHDYEIYLSNKVLTLDHHAVVME